MVPLSRLWFGLAPCVPLTRAGVIDMAELDAMLRSKPEPPSLLTPNPRQRVLKPPPKRMSLLAPLVPHTVESGTSLQPSTCLDSGSQERSCEGGVSVTSRSSYEGSSAFQESKSSTAPISVVPSASAHAPLPMIPKCLHKQACGTSQPQAASSPSSTLAAVRKMGSEHTPAQARRPVQAPLSTRRSLVNEKKLADDLEWFQQVVLHARDC